MGQSKFTETRCGTAGGTSEELSTAARGYMAYSGPYCVDEEHETLHHHVAISLFPNWIGNVQERHLRLQEELLTLSLTPASYGGQRLTPRLVWKRAKAEQLVNHTRPIDNEERTAQ
jgi:hypothetical protein